MSWEAPVYHSIEDAAEMASRRFGAPIGPDDLRTLIRIGILPSIPGPSGSSAVLRQEEVLRLAAKPMRHAAPGDLFSALAGSLCDGNWAQLDPASDGDSLVFLPTRPDCRYLV